VPPIASESSGERVRADQEERSLCKSKLDRGRHMQTLALVHGHHLWLEMNYIGCCGVTFCRRFWTKERAILDIMV